MRTFLFQVNKCQGVVWGSGIFFILISCGLVRAEDSVIASSNTEIPVDVTAQPVQNEVVEQEVAEQEVVAQEAETKQDLADKAFTEMSNPPADSKPQPEPEKPPEQVEINGDQVEFRQAENKVVASGHVVVVKTEVTLMSDELVFDRNTQVAVATGHVVLIRNGQRLEGDVMNFNFGSMTGDFEKARIYAKPFYGVGDKIIRVDDKHLVMENAYLTTSDWDKPEFRFGAKKVDIYPGDKAVARNVRMLAGNVPIVYLPKFTQDLRSKKPVVTYTPGYDSDWGAFLLTAVRYRLHDNFTGIVHMDYRHRKDFAWGLDGTYNTVYFGEGVFRTYYTHERNVNATHPFAERDPATIEKERYKADWRHRWEIDEKTNAVLQYFRAKDREFLKDYFEREFDKDEDPDTFFLLTRVFPAGTMGFRTDARVNRYETKVERLPEVSFASSSQEILNSGFFFNNQSTYSNLVLKTAAPSEDRTKTMRIDTKNELSYPIKLSIFELRPRIGGQQTYYSRARSKEDYDSIRGQLQTGADVSTKFFRIFNVAFNKWGIEVNRLRHVFTPSVDYEYTHDPTIPASSLDQFDAVDALVRSHKVLFSFENKLQTKRNERSADLTRLIIGTDFNLKEDPGKGGFNNITADWDLKPNDWLTFYLDSSYSALEEHLSSLNFDVYINDLNDRWFASLGKRYGRDVDDQLTTELGYRLNQKWAARTYTRFDLDTGTLKEQEYTLSRDLHSWVMDINYNQTRGDGTEIWLVLTLKDFPDLGFDFGSRFNRRKQGTYTSTDE